MLAGEQVIGFQISRNTAIDHFGRQSGAWRVLIPLTAGDNGLKIVTNNLLIKADLFTTRLPIVRWPKSGAVWRKDFINKNGLARAIYLTEFEFGIGDDDAFGREMAWCNRARFAQRPTGAES